MERGLQTEQMSSSQGATGTLELVESQVSSPQFTYPEYDIIPYPKITPAISDTIKGRILEEYFIRALDVIGAVGLLVLFLPALILVAIATKLFSGKGPIFYRQKRVGLKGRIFTLYKIRTMINGAERDSGPVWAQKDDARVTKIGRFFRATRLDEFPQLLNVLEGSMSLVGPRPERPFFVERHRALQGVRLSVKPGITGIAQIRSSYDLKPVHKLKYDYLYIQKRSLWLNIKILVKTIPVVLLKKGW